MLSRPYDRQMTGQSARPGRRPAHQPAWPRDPRKHAGGRAEVAGLRRSRLRVGQPHRQGDRRHLGRGEVSVRRRRRVVGGGAAPHRRTTRRPAVAAPPDARCASGSAPSSTPSTTGLTASDSRAIETLRMALPRDRPNSNGCIRAPPPSCSPGDRAGSRPARRRSPTRRRPERIREVAAFIPGAMRGITSERQLGTYCRPRCGPPRTDQRDRRLPRALELLNRGPIEASITSGSPSARDMHTSISSSPTVVRPR